MPPIPKSYKDILPDDPNRDIKDQVKRMAYTLTSQEIDDNLAMKIAEEIRTLDDKNVDNQRAIFEKHILKK